MVVNTEALVLTGPGRTACGVAGGPRALMTPKAGVAARVPARDPRTQEPPAPPARAAGARRAPVVAQAALLPLEVSPSAGLVLKAREGGEAAPAPLPAAALGETVEPGRTKARRVAADGAADGPAPGGGQPRPRTATEE